MRRRRLPVAAALAFVVIAGAGSAAAEPTAAEKETARQAFAEGKRKLAGGDAAGALASLKAAYALVPAPTTGVALARAQVANGKLVEARDTALAAAAMSTEGNEAFQNAALEARDLAARLGVTVPTINVHVKPADATVELDGKPVPAAARALPLRANPGGHRVTLSAPGYAPAERSFVLEESSTAEVDVALVPAPIAPPPSDVPAPVAASGGVPAWVWLTGGVAVVLTGVAIGARIDEANVESKIRDQCNGDVEHGCPQRSIYDPSADDSHKHVDFDLFIGSTVAAGAALSAATIGFLVSRRSTPAPTAARVRVEPLWTPGSGGASLRGVF